ncbi:hypothetical protein CP965_08465 [Halarcobacter mediterraneus]|uniref:Fe/B12 periplasmic-binding domain-containing protein n=1 Tax=Halarcobacter mediterraneus TaxID=2023153 RepID=A0A4Q1AWV3_9BACT|nr:ABC transporter substrate-binding protein [Halarcobacter mediterraneus]RXK12601.1 hypothetical protein CP965_08465 [Halarcobacter mediterraneus]
MIRFVRVALFCGLLTISSYASKIVSVGGSITETIVALGHKDKLIGVDLSSIYPKEVTSKLPNVGYWLSLPQEGILSLKPEVVIVSSLAKPKKVVENLPKYGIKTYIIEDKPSIEAAKKKISQVASILNEEEKAKEIISRIEKNIAKMQKEIKGKKKPKVLFLFSRGKGTIMAAGGQTKPGVMISLAGGVNAVDFKQYTKISSESILEMNPDVIITSNHAGDSGLDKNIVSSTNAGKNKQIYSMDMLLISGFTVRIDSALQDLSCMLNNNHLSYCE